MNHSGHDLSNKKKKQKKTPKNTEIKRVTFSLFLFRRFTSISTSVIIPPMTVFSAHI